MDMLRIDLIEVAVPVSAPIDDIVSAESTAKVIDVPSPFFRMVPPPF